MNLRGLAATIVSLTLVVPLVSCCPGGESGFNLGSDPIIIVEPDPVAFPTVGVGETVTENVTIINSADASGDLIFTAVRLVNATGDLSITQPLDMALAPGASTTMQVFYSPTDAQKDYGEIYFEMEGVKEPKIVPITTLEQVGTLQVSPDPVNFGSVDSGTTATKQVLVSNNGSKALEIGSSALGFDGSDDFKLLGVYQADGSNCAGMDAAEAIEPPFELAQGGTFCLDISYTPTGGGSDTSRLQIFEPYVPGAPNPTPLTEANVLGQQVGPVLRILPQIKLDFGAVPLSEAKTLSFSIVNDGNKEAILEAVAKGEVIQEAFDDVVIITEVPPGTQIAPGDGLTIDVVFTPSTTWPISYDPLGFIDVVSNAAPEHLTVFGQVAAPKIQVTPSELLDFGVVAIGKSAERVLTFTNTGTVDVMIDTLALSSNTPDDEFEILNPPVLPVTLADGDFLNVKLKFSNTLGPTGQADGVLSFTTNAPDAPTAVNLRALRTDTAVCKVELVPPQLNFGTVSYGKQKTLKMGVKNSGSGACGWKSVTLGSGFEIPGFISTCTGLGGSKEFSVVNTPFGCQDCIQPADIVYVEVNFAPEGGLFSEISELTGFSAGLQVTLWDAEQKVDVVVPELDPTSGSFACNVKAQSGEAALSAIPGEIDFGVTTVGCHSDTITVTLYNTGKAPLSVCDIVLEGCSPEVKLKSVPAVPPCTADGGGLVVTQSAPQELQVVYAPQSTNAQTCQLAIYENSDVPSLSLPISGSGTYDDDQTDVFVQTSGQQVDVLFIIDNSGSMSEEQDSLSQNFQALLTAAAAWSTDYRLGVVTTDMEANNPMAGKLMGPDSVTGGGLVDGYKKSLPRFVTAANVAEFKDMVLAGDGGSGTEQGLKAAQAAVSAPNNTTPNPLTECAVDADCGNFECVPSMLDPGKSYCGGWNMEFIRQDASLELVFVSDENDSSEADLNFYVDFLKSIKGFANENLFHAHAIVGPAGGCSGQGGTADDGSRYRYLAKETGGLVHSICDPNWGAKLEEIGNVAFGLKVQFFLTRPAIPSTITVTVAGKSCAAGWTYEPDSNSVIFDENGSCMPTEGDEIAIYYEVICFTE